MKALIFIILFLLFLIPTCSAQVINGYFNDGLNNWTKSCSGSYTSCDTTVDTTYGYSGGSARIAIVAADGYSNLYQVVNVSEHDTLTFYAVGTTHITEEYYGIFKYYIGGLSGTISSQTYHPVSGDYSLYEIDVSGLTGEVTLRFEAYGYNVNAPPPHDAYLYVDNIELVNLYHNLSGYVTNNLGNSVSSATITLNNSGGSTNSNDTGYYEITNIPTGTYSITATSPTNEDYSDTVSISADTEKNITMTRLTPALSNIGIIDSSENSLRIGWKENAVVDSVRIYKDSNTNLIATEDTSYVSLASYTVGNLDADTGYNFWLEPWDGSVSGIKYYVSGTTDGDGGGGGGGGGDPTPTATGTPGPTSPPWTNITDEDWLNLTRYEQEYILFEHDQLNITIGTYTPKAVNLSFWYLILFLGICSTTYGSQKKNGELLFTCGLVAVVVSMIKLGLF